MLENNEKRRQTRMFLRTEMYYKLTGNPEQHSGSCLSINGTGVSFLAGGPLPLGKAAELRLPKSALGVPVVAFVEIIRCLEIPNSGYQIAALIKSIKGS